MKKSKLAARLSLAIGGALVLGQVPAQAFTFDTNVEEFNGAKENIFLESVTIIEDDGSTGETITSFTTVTGATVVANDDISDNNPGAASVDVGDNADGEAVEAPSSEQVSEVLSNLNLNNIIDTEDRGSFEIDIDFANAVDNLFIWERGKNSDLKVQGLDGDGNLIGTAFTVFRSQWTDAGYSIDTTEIGGAQIVGSAGVSLADLGLTSAIRGFRLSSQSGFNGPDWKILGSREDRGNVASTPEPSAMLGLGLFTGILAISRRQKKNAVA